MPPPRAVRRVGDAAREGVPADAALVSRPLGVLELREDVTRRVEGGVRVVERRRRRAPTAERGDAQRKRRRARVPARLVLRTRVRRGVLFVLRGRFETGARFFFLASSRLPAVFLRRRRKGRVFVFRGKRRPRGVLQVVLQRQDVPGRRPPGFRVGRDARGVGAMARGGGGGGGACAVTRSEAYPGPERSAASHASAAVACACASSPKSCARYAGFEEGRGQPREGGGQPRKRNETLRLRE